MSEREEANSEADLYSRMSVDVAQSAPNVAPVSSSDILPFLPPDDLPAAGTSRYPFEDLIPKAYQVLRTRMR